MMHAQGHGYCQACLVQNCVTVPLCARHARCHCSCHVAQYGCAVCSANCKSDHVEVWDNLKTPPCDDCWAKYGNPLRATAEETEDEYGVPHTEDDIRAIQYDQTGVYEYNSDRDSGDEDIVVRRPHVVSSLDPPAEREATVWRWLRWSGNVWRLVPKTWATSKPDMTDARCGM